jgi:hypothetical protein
MKSFEIWYDDLSDEAKKNYLKFQGVQNERELNAEVIPLAIIDLEEENV